MFIKDCANSFEIDVDLCSDNVTYVTAFRVSMPLLILVDDENDADHSADGSARQLRWCDRKFVFDRASTWHDVPPKLIDLPNLHEVGRVQISSKKPQKLWIFALKNALTSILAKWPAFRVASNGKGFVCSAAPRADMPLRKQGTSDSAQSSPAAPLSQPGKDGESLADDHRDVLNVIAMMHVASRKVRSFARAYSLEAIAAPSEELCWPRVRSMVMTVAANYPENAADLAHLCERATDSIDRFFTQRTRSTVDDAHNALVAFANYLETLPDLRAARTC